MRGMIGELPIPAQIFDSLLAGVADVHPVRDARFVERLLHEDHVVGVILYQKDCPVFVHRLSCLRRAARAAFFSTHKSNTGAKENSRARRRRRGTIA